MEFERKVPDWKAEGVEPPDSLKSGGFSAGYKPPAAYFNWFWNVVSKCLAELQEKVKSLRAVEDGGTGKASFTAGNYLVGNGKNALGEKAPSDVCDDIGAARKNAAIPTVPAASEDGVVYTATVDGVTELYNGLIITIIPEVTSASTAIKLNVNGLGEKMVRLPLSFNSAAMTTPRLETYFSEGRPISLQFDANYIAGDGAWKTFGKQRASAQDLYGTVPIESGGTGADTPEAARAALGAVAMSAAVIPLPIAGWVGGRQTVEVAGATEENVILVTSAPACFTAYNGAGVHCIEQGDGTLTFAASKTPDADLTAQALMFT